MNAACAPSELSLRDARRLRAVRWRWALRTAACRVTQRHRTALTALGSVGVCGFVAAVSCMQAGLCDAHVYLAGVSGSLSALAASLLLFELGDPHELARLRARARIGSHGRAQRERCDPQAACSVWPRTPLRP